MSIQLYNAFVDILKLPYHKNDHSTSGKREVRHEHVVADVLERQGFKPVTLAKNIKREVMKAYKKNDDPSILPDIPAGTFIVQPCGTQSYPDMAVRDFNSQFYLVECKSIEKGGTPMWNDNPASHAKGIYILGSKYYNQNTAFLGKDVFPEKMLEILERRAIEQAELDARFNAELAAADCYNRGWKANCRTQHNQAGAGANYFTHPDIKKCEQAVLEFVSQ